MQPVGTNFGYLLVTFLNLILLGGWFVLSIIALFSLRRAQIQDTARALWAIFIVVIPWLGAIAYFIVKPDHKPPSSG